MMESRKGKAVILIGALSAKRMHLKVLTVCAFREAASRSARHAYNADV
jgi:hypothetical protein